MHGGTKTLAKRVAITAGSWSAQLVLPAGVASGSPVELAARFAGAPGFAAGDAARRLKAR